MHPLNEALPQHIKDLVSPPQPRPSSGEPTSPKKKPPRPTLVPGELEVGAEASHIVGPQFLGVSIAGVLPPVGPIMVKYLENFEEHSRLGHGVAFSGGQGTGKTACLALIAEAGLRTFEPIAYENGESGPPRVMYMRLPRLIDLFTTVPSMDTRYEWERTRRHLVACKVLLIDEAQGWYGGDRALNLLLDALDERIGLQRSTYLAMNARWDELKDNPNVIVRQVRDKLEASIRELAIPGASRRKHW